MLPLCRGTLPKKQKAGNSYHGESFSVFSVSFPWQCLLSPLIQLVHSTGMLFPRSLHRHALLQLFKPVEDDVDALRSFGGGRGFHVLHHQKPLAVWADVPWTKLRRVRA